MKVIDVLKPNKYDKLSEILYDLLKDKIQDKETVFSTERGDFKIQISDINNYKSCVLMYKESPDIGMLCIIHGNKIFPVNILDFDGSKIIGVLNHIKKDELLMNEYKYQRLLIKSIQFISKLK